MERILNMKWKADARIEREGKVYVCLGGRKKEIPEEDMFIVKLMEAGVTEDEGLLKEVSEQGGEHDEICAGFRLAQFVEDYGEFLEAAAPSRIFE